MNSANLLERSRLKLPNTAAIEYQNPSLLPATVAFT